MFFGFKLTDTDNPLYSHLLRWHNTSRIKTYFSKEIESKLNNYNSLTSIVNSLPEDFSQWSDLAKSQYLESTIFMSGYLLSSQGDRMGMGNSVEGRYPFLDYRVIEFSAKLPDSYKLNCLNEKFILKQISKGKIPDSITKRSKQAYRAPIVSSFFSPGAPSYVKEILSEKRISEYGKFDPAKVMSLIHKINLNTNISEMDQMAVAGILSTQLLYKLFIADPIIPNIELLAKTRIVYEN